jgi:hypothetical protein
MRTLFLLAIVLPVLPATPAGALTRDEARDACRQEIAGWTLREADRTGVTLMQRRQICLQEKMRANKSKARRT